jgi:hypothetical protein
MRPCKWTPELVRECRNIDMIHYRKMSVWARILMADAYIDGHAEYYSEAGWTPTSKEVGARWPLPTRSYRILPGWNPLLREAVKA